MRLSRTIVFLVDLSLAASGAKSDVIFLLGDPDFLKGNELRAYLA